VILDIQSSRTIQSTYVMLSRATSLDGIVILRRFDAKKVCAHSCQSLRDELKRLQIISYHTILNTPREHERHAWAQQSLDCQQQGANYGNERVNKQKHVPAQTHSLFDSDEEGDRCVTDATARKRRKSSHAASTNAGKTQTRSAHLPNLQVQPFHSFNTTYLAVGPNRSCKETSPAQPAGASSWRLNVLGNRAGSPRLGMSAAASPWSLHPSHPSRVYGWSLANRPLAEVTCSGRCRLRLFLCLKSWSKCLK
jgi:hypothetical protein